MTISLAANIDATQHEVLLDGDLAADPGDLFRLGDEMVRFLGYKVPLRPRSLDQAHVRFERGIEGTAKASHLSGVELLGVSDAFVSGDDEDEPNPFATGQSESGGGIASPLAITGCVLWLDASDATTINAGDPDDDDPVSAWADKSTSGFDAEQATAENQPVHKAAGRNGLSVIRFDPTVTPRYLDLPGAGSLFRNLPGSTVALISGNTTATTFYDNILYASIASDPEIPRVLACRCGFAVSNGNTPEATVFDPLLVSPSGPPVVHPLSPAADSDALGAGTWFGGWSPWMMRSDWQHVGGVQIQTGMAALSPTWNWGGYAADNEHSADTDSALVRVGASGDESAALADVGEIIVWNRCLNAVEARQVMDYLSVKWAAL